MKVKKNNENCPFHRNSKVKFGLKPQYRHLVDLLCNNIHNKYILVL